MGSLRARIAIAAALLGAGCGAPTVPSVVPRPERDPAAPEDLTIDAGEATLTGVRFEPEAVAAPSMLLVHGTRAASLERLRAAWAKGRGDRRAATARRTLDGQLLATALFEAARTDGARRAALLTEARAAITTLRDLTPGTTDETTLVMGAALAFATAEATDAEPYLTELAQRFGERPGGTMARTQLAFARLRDGDDAIARALVGAAAPTAAQPELAYVIAWVRFRSGDGPGAAAAITLAAQGWTAAAAQAAIDRDFLVMHARSGLPLAAAVDAVTAVAREAARRHVLLYQLSSAYAFAGQPALARGAIDAALAALPAAPVELVPSLRLLQAEYVRRAGAIDELAGAWRAAVAAVAACPGCSADDRKAIGDGLAARAVEAHTIFATSGDARYQRAAADLYRLFASLPGAADRADHVAVDQYAADFARVRAPVDGAQYRDALKVPLALRQQEVLACYEATLQGASTVGGAVTLLLEVDATGVVIGAATEPPRGAEGLAQLAGCIEDRAREWRLPGRARPGTARVTARYVLGASL